MDQSNNLQASFTEDRTNLMCGWELNISTLIMHLDKSHLSRLSLMGHTELTPSINMLEYIERFIFNDDRELIKNRFLTVSDENINSDRFFVRLINVMGVPAKFLLNLMVKEEGVLYGFIQPIDDLFLNKNNFTNSASLKTILENTKDSVFLVDEKATLVEFNPQFALVCKSLLNLDLLPGIQFSKFIPSDLLVEFKDCLARAYENEHVFIETSVVLNDHEFHIEVTVTPILKDNQVGGAAFFVKDVTRLRKFKRIDDLENLVLEQALRYQNIQDLFYSLLSGIESISESMTCYVTKKRPGEMILDWFSTVSIPEDYCSTICDIPIQMNTGSCGTAAYLRKPVMVTSILNSTYWDGYRDYTLLTGFKACFSFPILNRVGEVLGTFGCYLREERELSKFEYEMLLRGVKLTGILLDKYNNEQQIKRQTEDINEISSLMPGVLYKAVMNPSGERKFVYLGKKFRDFFGQDSEPFLNNYDLLWEFVNKEDIEKLKSSLKKSLDERSQWIVDTRIFNKDKNSDIWIRISAIHKFEEDGSVTTYGNFIDITKLKEDEVQLNAVISSIDDIVFLMSDDGIFHNVWSSSPEKLLLPAEEFIGKNIREIMSAEISDGFFNAVKVIRESGKEHEYEYSITHKGTTNFYRAKSGPIASSPYSDRLYYSVQDITDLKQARDEEEKLREILKVAEKLSRGGAWEYNIKTKEVIWSDELYEIFNVDRNVKGKELLYAYLNSLHVDDKEVQPKILAKAIEAGVPFKNDHRIVIDGVVHWICSTSKVIHDVDGNPEYLRGFTQDITEIKEYQEGIFKRDQIISDVGHLGKIGGWEFDVNTSYLSWTDHMYKIYNISPEVKGEALFNMFLSKIHEEDRGGFDKVLAKAMQDGTEYTTNHRVIADVDNVKYIKGRAFVQKDEHGRVVKMQGVCQDITELRSTQIAHQNDANLLQHAVELGKIGAWSFNKATKTLVWTSEIYKIFEFDKSVVGDELYNAYFACIHPDDVDELSGCINRLLTQDIPYSVEYRINTASGLTKYILCQGAPIVDSNTKGTYSGITQDITDRKMAEIEISRYSQLLDMIAVTSVRIDSEPDQEAVVVNLLEQIGRAVDVNRVYVFRSHKNDDSEGLFMSQRFEWTDGSVTAEINNPQMQNMSYSDNAVKDCFESLANGEVVMGNIEDFPEATQRILDGQEIKSLLIVPVKIDNDLWGYFGFDECRIPRQWKKAEVSFLKSAASIIANAIKRDAIQSALNLSEITYSSVISALSEGVVIHDTTGKIITCNKSAEEILGFSNTEIVGSDCNSSQWNVIDQNGENVSGKNHPASIALKTGEPVRNVVLGIKKPQQILCWISVNAEPIHMAGSSDMSGVAVTFTNVTEQFYFAKELNKLSAVARTTSNAVIITNAEFNIEWINNGFENISGYSLSDVQLKNPFNVLVSQNTDKDTLQFVEYCVAQQREFSIEMMFASKSGVDFFLHLEAQPMFNEKGDFTNFIIVGADLTENKKNELLISRSLKEKEILLAEIHHRVKNNLAIVSSLLQLQMLYSDDERIRSLMKESQSRLKSMALVHEKLYEGGDLSLVNFGQYIAEISDHIRNAYPNNSVDIDVQLNVNDVRLNIAQAVPCGLIMNEVLTNCFKYAFSGRLAGSVQINFEEKGDYYLLEVIDNGIGLPSDYDITKVKSLGITLIRTLTSQIKGTFELSSKNGTRVVITFPKQIR
ncbi:MAG TPA: PAS domain S-box protein [Bacteroidia bacterium]|jgi:PAS domain S-box-containing protein|nr:PAS domain S-box protein [Bacteroidia bacterium]